MILIQQRDSSGILKTCDAKCYNAHGKRCKCLCGGSNHGVGLNKAIDNLNLVAQKILEFPLPKLWRVQAQGIRRSLDRQPGP